MHRDLEGGDTTLVPEKSRHAGVRSGVPGLTILCHPDVGRVGEEAGLTGLVAGSGEDLSRVEPCFASPDGGAPTPLADRHLSRRPLRFLPLPDGGVRLDASGTRTPLSVDGTVLTAARDVDRGELEAGVVLVLGASVALLLHLFPVRRPRLPSFGLVGESTAMLHLREEIRRVADLDYPVLLRGETGTGKELVARAIHEAGGRRGKLVCVNMGAVPPTLAATELFGAEKGAYSGADRKRSGYFRQARGGTLFLDEIGDTPADVQVLLLRVLESGQSQPVGASDPVQEDARLISATDADLESAVDVGEFRLALYHRLSTCELELPTMRERRADFGRLFFHFLRQELEAIGEALDAGGDGPGWVSAELVGALAALAWRGNVRELRNVVRQLVVANRGETEMQVPARIQRLLESSATPSGEPHAEDVDKAGEPGPPAAYRHPREVNEQELRGALRDHRWNGRQTADALNVSPTSLYTLMRKFRVRTASDVTREEIADALGRCEGRIEDVTTLLEVSERGLKLRMTELGIESDAPAPRGAS